ncbi:hypothetical protein ABFU82_22500 [Nocardioides sp. WV_118_6]
MTLPPPDGLHNAAQAAAVLGVPARRIRVWAREGKIEPSGMVRAPVPGGQQPLYRLDEIRPLAEAYLARWPTMVEPT